MADKKKNKLEVRVEIEQEYLTFRNFSTVYSDVQFLAQKKIKHDGVEREPRIRYVTVMRHPESDNLKPYSLKYSILDFFTEFPELPEDKAEIEYTHAQVRDMKSAAR